METWLHVLVSLQILLYQYSCICINFVCASHYAIDLILDIYHADTARKLGCHGSTTTHPLWFRFNEGFSNAVRRPVRIQDLL